MIDRHATRRCDSCCSSEDVVTLHAFITSIDFAHNAMDEPGTHLAGGTVDLCGDCYDRGPQYLTHGTACECEDAWT